MDARTGELLAVLGLDGAGHTPVVDYSTGVRKKIGLATALLAPANRSWFPALYLPQAWRVPVASGFIPLGTVCFVGVYRLIRAEHAAGQAAEHAAEHPGRPGHAGHPAHDSATGS